MKICGQWAMFDPFLSFGSSTTPLGPAQPSCSVGAQQRIPIGPVPSPFWGSVLVICDWDVRVTSRKT